MTRNLDDVLPRGGHVVSSDVGESSLRAVAQQPMVRISVPSFQELRGKAAARVPGPQPDDDAGPLDDAPLVSARRIGSVALELAATPMAAGLARAFVTGVLAAEALEEIADTAELLVSELVTYAACHARTRSRLRLTIGERSVRIDLTGEHAPPPTLRHTARVVDAFADRWGYEQFDVGTHVWFELDVHTLDSLAGV
jgi:hypothetical protein